MTALMLASFVGDVEFVKFLLSRPEIDVNSQHPASGYTALHFACSSKNANQEEIFRLLLAHPDIDVNLVTNRNETALFIAVEISSLTIISMLLKMPGINVNYVGGKGPFTTAAYLRFGDVVSLMIDEARGLNVNQFDENGNSALYYAALFANRSILKKLLSVPGINVNIQNVEGETPLMAAAECEREYEAILGSCRESLRSLLSHQGISLNLQDSEGETAVFKAVEMQNLEAVKLLLEYGADASVPEFNGATPLSIAREYLDALVAQYAFANGLGDWHEDDIDAYRMSSENIGEIINLLKANGAV